MTKKVVFRLVMAIVIAVPFYWGTWWLLSIADAVFGYETIVSRVTGMLAIAFSPWLFGYLFFPIFIFICYILIKKKWF
ncbi:MAG: hypothetical protein ACK5VG_04670 [Burkholderiales bacterium]|jgi:hypothetical protein